jgi:protoporphyrinogen oxidase
MAQKEAIIIGAGPAGLTAAYELLDKTDIKPIIYDNNYYVGGIAKTINHNGNRMDMGVHRFFSKSEKVKKWWLNIIPLQGALARDDKKLNREIPLQKQYYKRGIGSKNLKKFKSPDPEKNDMTMLNRYRLTRILFQEKFFDYPISFNYSTILNIGILNGFKIISSYLKTSLKPIKEEKSLEDFFINRFGRELYLTFFKDYTEKVWGVPCTEIKPDWGIQRTKGLSIKKAILHSLKKTISISSSQDPKKVETSLIETYMYPKYGAGQIWCEVARIIKENGGEINLAHEVIGIKNLDNLISETIVKDLITGDLKTIKGDYFFSSMPIKDLIHSITGHVPLKVKEVANGLKYRDFITMGLLLKDLKLKNKTKIKTLNNMIPDSWLYIQERDVKMGRISIITNFSPYMVKDDNSVWIALEYFCSECDYLWNMSEKEFKDFAIEELVKMNIIEKNDVIDNVICKIKKAYPSYFGSYENLDVIKEFTNNFENLFLIGRNGMHIYNNMDHSMLTAMTAVRNIINGVTSKDNLWNIAVEEEYPQK